LPTYSKFLDVHEIQLTPREFSIVMDVIPTGVLELLSANTQNSITPPFAFYLIDTAIGNLCFFPGVVYTTICSLLQKDIVTMPNCIVY